MSDSEQKYIIPNLEAMPPQMLARIMTNSTLPVLLIPPSEESEAEQTLLVIKAMAMGYNANSGGHDECIYCDHAPHLDACPIAVARDLLQRRGIPMKEYRIDFEKIWTLGPAPSHPVACSYYRSGCSEPEALQAFLTTIEHDEYHAHYVVRNIQVVFLRETEMR